LPVNGESDGDDALAASRFGAAWVAFLTFEDRPDTLRIRVARIPLARRIMEGGDLATLG